LVEEYHDAVVVETKDGKLPLDEAKKPISEYDDDKELPPLPEVVSWLEAITLEAKATSPPSSPAVSPRKAADKKTSFADESILIQTS